MADILKEVIKVLPEGKISDAVFGRSKYRPVHEG